MTTETTSTTYSTQGSYGTDCLEPPPDPHCKPHLIDEIACRSEGLNARAKYDSANTKDLGAAKDKYDAQRIKYREERRKKASEVQDLRHQVKHLLERIRCHIEQKRVWQCLDQAFCVVVDELACCDDTYGCCADGECEFPTDLPPADDSCTPCDALRQRTKDLTQRITDYETRTKTARDCFERLAGEADALTKRVTDATDDIKAITAELSSDEASTDLKRTYTKALVANRDIQRIWNGFAQTQDYVDCLCWALTCWTKGFAAISELTGELAIAACQQGKAEAHCTHLREKTVEETLAVYDKLCPQSAPCDEPAPPNGCDDVPTKPCDAEPPKPHGDYCECGRPRTPPTTAE
jgi:hypothetical protein